MNSGFRNNDPDFNLGNYIYGLSDTQKESVFVNARLLQRHLESGTHSKEAVELLKDLIYVSLKISSRELARQCDMHYQTLHSYLNKGTKFSKNTAVKLDDLLDLIIATSSNEAVVYIDESKEAPLKSTPIDKGEWQEGDELCKFWPGKLLDLPKHHREIIYFETTRIRHYLLGHNTYNNDEARQAFMQWKQSMINTNWTDIARYLCLSRQTVMYYATNQRNLSPYVVGRFKEMFKHLLDVTLKDVDKEKHSFNPYEEMKFDILVSALLTWFEQGSTTNRKCRELFKEFMKRADMDVSELIETCIQSHFERSKRESPHIRPESLYGVSKNIGCMLNVNRWLEGGRLPEKLSNEIKVVLETYNL